jgi:hypothetical protein
LTWASDQGRTERERLTKEREREAQAQAKAEKERAAEEEAAASSVGRALSSTLNSKPQKILAQSLKPAAVFHKRCTPNPKP